MKKPTNQTGLTLIEMLIAVVIAGSVFIFLMSSLLSAFESRNRTAGVLVLQKSVFTMLSDLNLNTRWAKSISAVSGTELHIVGQDDSLTIYKRDGSNNLVREFYPSTALPPAPATSEPILNPSTVTISQFQVSTQPDTGTPTQVTITFTVQHVDDADLTFSTTHTIAVRINKVESS